MTDPTPWLFGLGIFLVVFGILFLLMPKGPAAKGIHFKFAGGEFSVAAAPVGLVLVMGGIACSLSGPPMVPLIDGWLAPRADIQCTDTEVENLVQVFRDIDAGMIGAVRVLMDESEISLQCRRFIPNVVKFYCEWEESGAVIDDHCAV